MRINYPFLAVFLACLCVVSSDVTGERTVAPVGSGDFQSSAMAYRQTDEAGAHAAWVSLIPAPVPPAANRTVPKIVIDLR
jgi:hypothetical protein